MTNTTREGKKVKYRLLGGDRHSCEIWAARGRTKDCAMTLAKFELLVLGEGVGKNDREWFPKWLRHYAMNFPNGLVGNQQERRPPFLAT